MLNKDAMAKEIEQLSNFITAIDLARAVETDMKIKNELSAANGQLKAGRTWLLKIARREGWL